MTTMQPQKITSFDPKPPVVWITGMSGAGKSTLANALVKNMRNVWPCTILVDGDSVREICGNDLSYSKADRLANAYRISKLCRFLNDQGALVICSTISFFHEIHDWNRTNLTPYIEAHLKVDVAELKRRDSKGLYNAKVQNENVVGIDQVLEEPKNPDLVLNNTSQSDFDQNLQSLIRTIYKFSKTPLPE